MSNVSFEETNSGNLFGGSFEETNRATSDVFLSAGNSKECVQF